MIPAVRAIGRAALAAKPLSLDELNNRAELLARYDNSYLVPVEVFDDFAALLTDPRRSEGPFRALSLNGRRWFSYRSTYYDTADLRTYHDHRQGRRLRYKIRERIYQDSGERQFEIKLKNGRGETVKHRRRLDGDEQPLDAAQQGFLSGVLGGAYGIEAPEGLTPSLVTDYQRATFVADGQRITCDAGLVVRDLSDGRTVRSDGGLVLVETKTRGHLTEADRMLHRFGVRAAEFTKYCGGFAALRPELGINRWSRSVRKAFPRATAPAN
ncbi:MULTISPECIES: polyphosphate polymerase domain-containing protein [unclassified Streptomyces]|uniref:polyphosphate polymerase domain-containing protein n=1 Tax=unclassified Streptomyces TaxID=2593676 RepID=UPI00278C47EA|nr:MULTISPECIES: polyphosphate polymerase domain-containing protein [unclassified Streptomyces]